MALKSETSNSEQRQGPWALIALILTGMAVITHGYLAIQNFKLKAGVAEKSLCNISSVFNCDSVALSSYAQFLGIPIAIWGAITNLVLVFFLIMFMANLSQNRERLERALFWLAAIVLAATLVMGTISTLFLHTYCLFCVATYCFSAIQFICVYLLQTTSPLKHFTKDVSQLFSQQVWITALIAIIPIGAFLANSMIGDAFGFRNAGRIIQESLFDWQKSEVQTFSADGLHIKTGSGPARMVIVEFADFLCPHCKHAAPTLHNFAETRKDVEFIFKPFPLDGSCNGTGSNKGDGHRCKLAAAVICAESLSGKGWTAHDYFFERQESLTLAGFPKNLEEVATITGTGKEAMQTCVDSEATMTKITKFGEEGTRGKIQGTPTFFVNGKILQRGQFFPVLDALYVELGGK